jgi:hypothetical protein
MKELTNDLADCDRVVLPADYVLWAVDRIVYANQRVTGNLTEVSATTTEQVLWIEAQMSLGIALGPAIYVPQCN